jgi:hypothetical protein
MTKEQFEGTIVMDHVPHVNLRKMMEFFYETDYDEDLQDTTDITILQLLVQMFLLADQYDIPGLLSIAEEKFRARCVSLGNALESLHVMRDLYAVTPPSIVRLRKIACMVLRGYLPEVLNDAVAAECYERTPLGSPEFMKDLLQSYIYGSLIGYCDMCRLNQSMECLQTRCRKCDRGHNGLRRVIMSSVAP